MTSAVIRAYAAYNIHDKVYVQSSPLCCSGLSLQADLNLYLSLFSCIMDSAYELCMWSFVIALAHFISETFVYKTAKMGPGIISPLIVACKLSIGLFCAYPQRSESADLSEIFSPVSSVSAWMTMLSLESHCHVPSLRRLRQVILLESHVQGCHKHLSSTMQSFLSGSNLPADQTLI